MKFKVGDRVRFLSSTGGGVVTKIVSPSIVNVAIDDGFDIPTAVSDLVKIEPDGKAASRFFDQGPENTDNSKNKRINSVATTIEEEPEMEAFEDDRIIPLPSSARRAANPAGVYLAFIPSDQKWLITGDIDVMIVNFSDHDFLYNWFIRGKKGGWRGVDYGVIPPLAAIHVDRISRDKLSQWCDGVIQLMQHIDKPIDILAPASVEYTIKTTKLMRDESYKEYLFVEGKAFVYELLPISSMKSIFSLGEFAGKAGLETNIKVEAKQAEPESFISRHKSAHREAEVDLHIEKMVSDYKELEPASMLSLQVSYFVKCLESAIAENYYKVTFIHGIGNGVLKSAIIQKLKEYKQVWHQQASAGRYGLGAIDVMITHEK